MKQIGSWCGSALVGSIRTTTTTISSILQIALLAEGFLRACNTIPVYKLGDTAAKMTDRLITCVLPEASTVRIFKNVSSKKLGMAFTAITVLSLVTEQFFHHYCKKSNVIQNYNTVLSSFTMFQINEKPPRENILLAWTDLMKKSSTWHSNYLDWKSKWKSKNSVQGE